jgi:hypothetical protein
MDEEQDDDGGDMKISLSFAEAATAVESFVAVGPPV